MASSDVPHPYHPRDLKLPNYVPNVNSIGELLGIFFSLCGVVVVAVWIYNKQKPTGVRVKICWFVVCGFIHCILEGYFSVFNKTLIGESTYLAQMWKEYGKGDSRYLISDSFMVAMESITAFVDGPLCFLTAAALMSRQMAPYRHVLQLVASTCQLYGDSMYYFTEVLEGFQHSEMWHPLHFWFYFVFLNSLWIVIPLLCIVDASWNLVAVQARVDTIDKKFDGASGSSGSNSRRTTPKKKKYF